VLPRQVTGRPLRSSAKSWEAQLGTGGGGSFGAMWLPSDRNRGSLSFA
jgi:hypothetical protein